MDILQQMDQNLRTIQWNDASLERSLSWALSMLFEDNSWLPWYWRIQYILHVVQAGYYPILALVSVPSISLTILVLSRKQCGLSNCVTHYLVAMAVADLLVIILDLILRQIPIVFYEQFYFMWSLTMCNIHAVLLYAATDCSVWFTVTFTFDRFVAICTQRLKGNYCTEKTAVVVLITVTVLSCLKNIFWYFMLLDDYYGMNDPWFCSISLDVLSSPGWGAIVFAHYILNPCVPFIVILMLNVLTVSHIIVTSRARRRLCLQGSGVSAKDPELESRRKSIILLFVISANFIVLWSLYMFYSIWRRMMYLGYKDFYMPYLAMELGFMLQILSCCTNTIIYAVTQTRFKQQLKNMLKYPLILIHQYFQFQKI